MAIGTARVEFFNVTVIRIERATLKQHGRIVGWVYPTAIPPGNCLILDVTFSIIANTLSADTRLAQTLTTQSISDELNVI